MKKDGFIRKKHRCLWLVLLFAFAFTGCGNASADSTSEKPEKAGQTEQSGSGNTAVVYFSATGTTAEAARPAISSDLSAVSEHDVIYLGHPKMEYGFDCILSI